jgi:DNA modification methylase|nr:MAG TPA: adenine specific DNA methyltransferase [Caudoviricetes sp.]
MLAVEYRKPDDLKPYDRNSRTHSKAQVETLARSIREYGFTNPILLDEDGVIIAGHGRLQAAREVGLEQVPTITLRGLSEAQRRALVLADNRIALDAGWDIDLLKLELADLRDEGFDLSLTGFSLEEIDTLLDPAADEKDPDDAPALPDEPQSKPGDVYLLGAHRLIVGDATDVGVLGRLMDGAMADVVWTDPPYNVAYESAAGKIANDNMGDKAFYDFLLGFYSAAFAWMKPGAAIYVAHADTEGLNFRGAFKAAGFKLSGCIIWRKDALVLGRSDYQWQHEPILYGWKPGSAHRWYGGRKQTTVMDLGEDGPFTRLPDGRFQIQVGDRVMILGGAELVEEVVPSVIRADKPKRSSLHPTMKPVELIERMLRHNARPGDLVLDPFGGSGSTLIAADRLGMCARLVELDPRYADVIVGRWEAWSGRKAERA